MAINSIAGTNYGTAYNIENNYSTQNASTDVMFRGKNSETENVDTFEKKSLSTGKKVVIGVGILGTIAGGIYLVKSGKGKKALDAIKKFFNKNNIPTSPSTTGANPGETIGTLAGQADEITEAVTKAKQSLGGLDLDIATLQDYVNNENLDKATRQAASDLLKEAGKKTNKAKDTAGKIDEVVSRKGAKAAEKANGTAGKIAAATENAKDVNKIAEDAVKAYKMVEIIPK